tara:strand:+ start:319 stop:678 length:360 start_codon:yes stop_codon:yes gene_type:complete
MQYTLFLAAEPGTGPEYGSEAFKTYIAAYGVFGAEAREAGVMIMCQQVEAAETATTLRKEGDEIKFHDGPFAELKEQISGWYLLECENLEEALKWAAKVPMVAFGYGSVEVRPVPQYAG